MEINERNLFVLVKIIEKYEKTGQDVGSLLLSRDPAISYSSSTLRNIMGELTEQKLIKQTHISSGRIPTDAGYRVYFNNIQKYNISDKQKHCIKKKIRELPKNLKQLLQGSTQLLADSTNCISFITLPSANDTIFKTIHFLQLNLNQVLVVLISKIGVVNTTVFETQQQLSQEMLHNVSNYLNETYKGVQVKDLKKRLISDVTQYFADKKDHIVKIVRLSQKAFSLLGNNKFYICGEELLLKQTHSSTNAFELLKALKDKPFLEKFASTLKNETKGINIWIGKENLFPPLTNYGLILSNYTTDKRILGVIGVIGPRRMDYKKVSSITESTAIILSKEINKLNKDR